MLTALLALVACGVFAASAQAVPLSGSADPLPGSSFEGGDGNQEVDGLLNVDWATAIGVRHFPDPQLNDQIFKGGSKENEPALWNFVNQTGGSTPGKNNILDAYALVEETADDTFLHLAFTRGNDTGTTFMAFELNQRADLWDNGVAKDADGNPILIPCRTTGDIIVSLQVSGNDPDVILQTWTTTATDPDTGCATAGTLTDFDDFTDNVDAQAAVNDTAIDNFLPASFDWPNDEIGKNLFVEASLNLTTLLEGALDTPCFSFGSIWMHTRASTSDSSNLDDYIAPEPLLVRNCTASGVKYHDLNANGTRDEGEPGLAGFRIWADYDNDGVLDANEPFDDTDADGNYTIENVQDPSGTYSLREMRTPPATGTGGWICSEPTTTGTNGVFPCAYTGIPADTKNATGDFGNYKKATITVEKQTDPDGSDASFDFTADGQTDFSLTDGQTKSFEVDPGSYDASELVPDGWTLTDITCDDDDSTGDTDTGTATFDVVSDEDVTCVFTNTQDATVTIVKQTDPDGSDQSFGFSGDFGDFSLADGEETSFTVSAGDFGTYAVSEDALAGWSLAEITCVDEGDTDVDTRTATLDVDPGDDITCTFFNEQDATVTIVKDADPNSAQDFGFSGDFGEFALDDDADGALGNSETFTVSAPDFGSYTVTEDEVDGWSLVDIDCTEGDTSVAGRSATLDVDPGDTITCTFTNNQLGTVTVHKTEGENPLPEGSEWKFTLNGEEQSTDPDGDIVWSGLQPGEYTLCEINIPAGWFSDMETLEGAEVTQNDDGTHDVCITFDVAIGQTVSLDVDNFQPAINIEKSANTPM